MTTSKSGLLSQQHDDQLIQVMNKNLHCCLSRIISNYLMGLMIEMHGQVDRYYLATPRSSARMVDDCTSHNAQYWAKAVHSYMLVTGSVWSYLKLSQSDIAAITMCGRISCTEFRLNCSLAIYQSVRAEQQPLQGLIVICPSLEVRICSTRHGTCLKGKWSTLSGGICMTSGWSSHSVLLFCLYLNDSLS